MLRRFESASKILYYIDKQLPILGALPNFIGIHRLWRAETLFIDALFIATKKEVEMLRKQSMSIWEARNITLVF